MTKPDEPRTFKSRLEFLNKVHSNPYTEEEVLASSVSFKLNKSYEQYMDDVQRSLDALLAEDETKVLNKIK